MYPAGYEDEDDDDVGDFWFNYVEEEEEGPTLAEQITPKLQILSCFFFRFWILTKLINVYFYIFV